MEWELNTLSKVLFGVMLALSLLMVVMRGLHGAWPLQFFRYLILFSSIIPISLRVNLDMAKMVYTSLMMRDTQMPGLIARSSNIPEELGRVVYVFYLVNEGAVCESNKIQLANNLQISSLR